MQNHGKEERISMLTKLFDSMKPKDYYYASLYVLAYIVLLTALNFLASLVQLAPAFLSGVGAEPSSDTIFIIFTLALGIFSLYYTFKKAKKGFYAGLLF